eukprot:COSAG05_NODE_2988_length_2434_cov_5.364026_3_plen_206_part_00
MDTWFPDAFSAGYLRLKGPSSGDGPSTPATSPARAKGANSVGTTPRSTAKALARALFLKYDDDGSDSLDRAEVKQVLAMETGALANAYRRPADTDRSANPAAVAAANSCACIHAGLSTEDGYIDGVLDAFDTDGDGVMDIHEFAALYTAVICRDLPDDADQPPPDSAASQDLDSQWFWRGIFYQWAPSRHIIPTTFHHYCGVTIA